MWKLIKAEIAYNWIITAVANFYCLLMLMAIWIGASRPNRAPLIMLVLLTSVFLASYTGEEKRVEQKRERLQTLCPLPIWQIGLMKSVYPLTIWINIVGVYLLSYFLLSLLKTLTFTRPLQFFWLTGPSFVQILTLNGWVLIANSVYIIARDYRVTSRGGKMVIFRFVQVLISFVVIIPFLIITNFLGVFSDNSVLAGSLSRLSFSPLGFFGFNIFGVVLFVLSVVVFSRRRSYAKS